VSGASPPIVFALSNNPTFSAACPPSSVAAGVRYLHALRAEGLYSRFDGDGLPGWRVSVEPYWLTTEEGEFLDRLGPMLLAFYRSLNRLYYQSLKTPSLAWVARYLDQGKPPTVVEHGRMRRLREQLPGIIRPDLLITESGWVASELDAVPGGFGLTAAFQRLYGEDAAPVGGMGGVVEGMSRMVGNGAWLAIVVSDESADYRPEMRYLARALSAHGTPAVTVAPTEVVFGESGLTVILPDGPARIDVLYRFFELFDLKNIPKSELFLYAAKKETVRMTPPVKAFLEEKLAMALWHHPALSRWWRDDVGARTAEQLDTLFPRTWILDPSPVPPHAVIAGFEVSGRSVRNWQELGEATQRERRLVIKPSGFSALAWGGRGVVVGHDHSAPAWRSALEAALAAFPTTPHVLQQFHTARRDDVCYLEQSSGETRSLAGRTRLSPYYFVSGDDVTLGGVLATTCSLDKKIIHGMKDAVLAPCAIRPSVG
jgi:hypothetical protein